MMKLNNKQLEFVGAGEKITMWRSGRRTGKTHALLYDCISKATEGKAINIWFIAHNNDVIDACLIEQFKDMAIALKTNVKRPDLYSFEFDNGSKLEIKSSESGKERFVKGEVDKIYVDTEVKLFFIDDLEKRLSKNGQIKIAYCPMGLDSLEENADIKIIEQQYLGV